MDNSVIRAMARWPNVPSVYGWMSLDRRGRWCLQGSPVLHRGAIGFMNRNYACTDRGLWYFQNGPQRVFVDLEYTPLVFTLDGSRNLLDHTGRPAGQVLGAWIDEEGNLLLMGERGIGLLCDRDLQSLADDFHYEDDSVCDEEGIARLLEGSAATRVHLNWHGQRIPIATIQRRRVAEEFGFEPRPRAEDVDE